MTEAKINHFDFISILIKEFPFLKEIISERIPLLTDNAIDYMLNKIDNGTMPGHFKLLTLKIIKHRRDILLKLCEV